ncbi:hypothetical protein AMAG_16266 [Allomyces macrogynus ATCC 38327]|uniref:SH3 domain-containing protein n=1 Tax=Allomyces macrogynus (strain ATCC 38327) TaxID=578462 RepID=A0A0L0TB69_ALLM3|nr:hypothetical protein AMAG_16266 [Allomyces macrogynus ATCC 38327]|eukprot:KNE71834.1 hypothetical protein AMAG_16266 [Allomyces macrogynus ATCC 38327]
MSAVTPTALGCLPRAALATDFAVASGSGPGMDANGCRDTCISQQALLRATNTAAGSVTFNFFGINPVIGTCLCAPALDEAYTKLPDAQCRSSTGTGLSMYQLGGTPVAGPSPTSTGATSTGTSAKATSTNDAGHGARSADTGQAASSSTTTTSTTNGAAETAPSATSIALWASLGGLALICAVLAVLYVRQRRRAASDAATSSSKDRDLSMSPYDGKPPEYDPHGSTTAPVGVGVAAMPAKSVGPVTMQSGASAAPLAAVVAPPPVPAPMPTVVNPPPRSVTEIVADPRRAYPVQQGYVPTLDDELALFPHDTVVVLELYDDGWALGSLAHLPHRRGAPEGVFPLPCLVDSGDVGPATAVAMPYEPVPTPAENPVVRPVRIPGLAHTDSDAASYLSLDRFSQRHSSMVLTATHRGLAPVEHSPLG